MVPVAFSLLLLPLLLCVSQGRLRTAVRMHMASAQPAAAVLPPVFVTILLRPTRRVLFQRSVRNRARAVRFDGVIDAPIEDLDRHRRGAGNRGLLRGAEAAGSRLYIIFNS